MAETKKSILELAKDGEEGIQGRKRAADSSKEAGIFASTEEKVLLKGRALCERFH